MSKLDEQKKAVASHMGKQHHSKPVTASDKVMSKRHLKHRAELDGDKEKLLKKSIKYNEAHMKEHEKALKKAAKELK